MTIGQNIATIQIPDSLFEVYLLNSLSYLKNYLWNHVPFEKKLFLIKLFVLQKNLSPTLNWCHFLKSKTNLSRVVLSCDEVLEWHEIEIQARAKWFDVCVWKREYQVIKGLYNCKVVWWLIRQVI